MPESYDIVDVEAWNRTENKETLEEMMSILSDDERRVVQMRIDGCGYEHIANTIGTTPAAVRQTMYRAKRAMREQINHNQ